MRLSVQTDNLGLLSEAAKSGCHGLRFGSEFCEHLLPSAAGLERAYSLAQEAGKPFIYVTPRLGNAAIERLRDQFAYLNARGEVSVVFNDYGTLHLLRQFPNLRPHLGRHLIMVRARSPWLDTHIRGEQPGSGRRQWVEALYRTTSLNYRRTLDLYRSLGCQRADMDWVPRVFPAIGALVESGWRVSVHLHMVPVTFTRRCHTARFLGEESLETCRMPCRTRAFVLRNEILREFDMDLILHGNAVFRVEPPSREGISELEQVGVAEVILAMNPVTRVHSAADIQEVMKDLLLGAPS